MLDPTCTDEELDAKYAALKAQYSEDRFLEGEAGKQGAIHLSELEEAYAQIHAARAQAKQNEMFGDDLDRADALIKEGKLDLAQQKLDTVSSRTGRWHYLQSIVYYKRNWYQDSLQQLNIAISLEPDNEQYKRSRELLEQNMKTTIPPEQQTGPQGAPPPQMDDSMGMANCCQTLCCASCCCDMMRCFGCG